MNAGRAEFAVRNPLSGRVITVPDNSEANALKMVALVPESAVMTRTVTEWTECGAGDAPAEHDDVRACAQFVTGSTHLQVLKLSEEAGEAAGKYIGWTGNPRPGKEATRDEFVYEVCDVALAAMVVLENLGEDSRALITAHAAKVRARFEGNAR